MPCARIPWTHIGAHLGANFALTWRSFVRVPILQTDFTPVLHPHDMFISPTIYADYIFPQ